MGEEEKRRGEDNPLSIAYYIRVWFMENRVLLSSLSLLWWTIIMEGMIRGLTCQAIKESGLPLFLHIYYGKCLQSFNCKGLKKLSI